MKYVLLALFSTFTLVNFASTASADSTSSPWWVDARRLAQEVREAKDVAPLLASVAKINSLTCAEITAAQITFSQIDDQLTARIDINCTSKLGTFPLGLILNVNPHRPLPDFTWNLRELTFQ